MRAGVLLFFRPVSAGRTRFCADCQCTVSCSNWSRHLRRRHQSGGVAQQSRCMRSSAGSSTTAERTTFRVPCPYVVTTPHRVWRRRRAFVIGAAARACSRRAAELFAWGASLSTVRCRIQAEFRCIPYHIREASLVASQEVLRVIRRRTDPRPPHPYYGRLPASRRRSFRVLSSEPQRPPVDASSVSIRR